MDRIEIEKVKTLFKGETAYYTTVEIITKLEDKYKEI